MFWPKEDERNSSEEWHAKSVETSLTITSIMVPFLATPAEPFLEGAKLRRHWEADASQSAKLILYPGSFALIADISSVWRWGWIPDGSWQKKTKRRRKKKHIMRVSRLSMKRECGKMLMYHGVQKRRKCQTKWNLFAIRNSTREDQARSQCQFCRND